MILIEHSQKEELEHAKAHSQTLLKGQHIKEQASLAHQLDYLNSYGRTKETADDAPDPWHVVIYWDSLPSSFGLQWYVREDNSRGMSLDSHPFLVTKHPQLNGYRQRYFGALIFHSRTIEPVFDDEGTIIEATKTETDGWSVNT